MHDILNATQAAKVIGCRWGEVVEKGKAGVWPFVKVIPDEKLGRKKDSYEIPKRDLANYLKIPFEEVDKRLGKEKTQ